MAARHSQIALRIACFVGASLLFLAVLASSASSRGHVARLSRAQMPGEQVPTGIKARLSGRSDGELAQVTSKLRDAGVSILREDVAWSTIEPKPGRYYWAGTDRWVAAAAEQGLQVMAVLDAPPSWVTERWSEAPVAGQELSDFATFAREVVARYGADGTFWSSHPNLPAVPIRYWDVWNEPYVPRFWTRDFPDPAGYARMFKTVVQVARTADPSARFMLEADTRIIATGWPWKPFLAQMFEAVPDLGKYAYGVSIHPYQGDAGSPRSCTPNIRSPGVRSRWQATALQFCRIEDVRHILDANDASDVKIWITEIGWSTAPSGDQTVSEAAQARFVHQVFNLVRTRYTGLVSGLIWYEYQGPESDPANADDYLGLVRADGQPKPGWQAFVEEATRQN